MMTTSGDATPADRAPGMPAIGPLADPRAAVKPDDGFVAVFLSAPAANWILRRIEHTAVTPNQVTVLSAVVAIAAALCFATGVAWGLVTGAILLQLSFVFDCLDGQLARYRGLTSPLGAWLDYMTDSLEDIVLIAGLAVGCAVRSGTDAPYLWSFLALIVLYYRRFDAILLERVLGADYVSLLREPMRALDDEGKIRVIATARDHNRPGWGRLARLLDWLSPRATDRPHPVILWTKRALLFREGERYFAISLLAVIGHPEWIFPTIIVLGGVLYPLTTVRRFQLFGER